MFDEYPDVLTAEMAADALRVVYNALYRMLFSGKLKAYKNGRVWRIPKESTKEYILDCTKMRR